MQWSVSACVQRNGMEWSGRKAGESAVVRGRNSADTWREVSRWVQGNAKRQANAAQVTAL